MESERLVVGEQEAVFELDGEHVIERLAVRVVLRDMVGLELPLAEGLELRELDTVHVSVVLREHEGDPETLQDMLREGDLVDVTLIDFVGERLHDTERDDDVVCVALPVLVPVPDTVWEIE